MVVLSQPTQQRSRTLVSRRLVLLHGWGASGEDLQPLADQLAVDQGPDLETICLDAPELHPTTDGRQWYELFPANWSAVPAAVQRLHTRLMDLGQEGAPLERTVILGFSQGGAMALDCGCALPVAGVISCSGYPHPNWKPSENHPPVLLTHGRADQVVPSFAMEEIRKQLNPMCCEAHLMECDHTIDSDMVESIRRFLQRVIPSRL